MRRLLLVGLALLLRNVWALLHVVVLAERRRGGPRLRGELLTLAAMLVWVADALKQEGGPVTAWRPNRHSPSDLRPRTATT
jgi:hypothetical protein